MSETFKEQTTKTILNNIIIFTLSLLFMGSILGFSIGSNVVEAQVVHNCYGFSEIVKYLYQEKLITMINWLVLLSAYLYIVFLCKTKIIPEILTRTNT